LVVAKFTRGTTTLGGLPTGSWQLLSTTGPFPDNGCFSNGKCWTSAPYYTTIRYGNIDGSAGTSVIGWGGDGIEAWKWSGSGWTQLAGVPSFGDAANALSGVRLADIDGDGRADLMTWSYDMVVVKV